MTSLGLLAPSSSWSCSTPPKVDIDAPPFSSNRAFTAAHTSTITCSLSTEARTARGCKSAMAPSAGMVSVCLVTISRGVPDRTAMNRQSRTHDARRDSGCCVQLPRWCARRSVVPPPQLHFACANSLALAPAPAPALLVLYPVSRLACGSRYPETLPRPSILSM